MATDNNTVIGLQQHIRDLEVEIVDAKKMVNRLLVRTGQPPIYSEADTGSEVGNISALRSDQFYGKALSGAIRAYLQMRKHVGPANVNEIYDSLCKGGFTFETENEENRKRNLRISLTKNTSIFHRLPSGTFGLPEWYESVKPQNGEEDKKSKKGRGRPKKHTTGKKAGKDAKPEAKKEDSKDDAETSTVEEDKTPTMVKAVRMALESFTAEFTKQDVVDWIARKYPALKAQQKKPSIAAMMGNLKKELNIETVSEGNGKEPHKYRVKK
jgi:hypothetical protein